tara:strand:- start:34758 stop:34916 length:159 start_codon:yes stop_codon:yes gene_type:complete
MIKEVIKQLNYDFFAEGALVLFLIAFALVGIKTALTSKRETKHQSEIPLSDD